MLLVASASGWIPLACYDPLTADLRGPADCADLVPPGAPIHGRPVLDRGPAACSAVGTVLKVEGATRGLATWPKGVKLSGEHVDLDADGRGERVRRVEGVWQVQQGERVFARWPCQS